MRLCVFTGSQHGDNPAYAAMAEDLGRTLASTGIDLVYGGGNVGLMGIIAQTTIDAGGTVYGIMPRHLVDVELSKDDIANLEIVPDMHTRKARMAELSDAFVALPGGIGTLEELFEVWTWQQLGIHAKPVALLNVDGFWDPLVAFLGRQVDAGFVRSVDLDSLIVAQSPQELLDALSRWHAPQPKWTAEAAPRA